MVLALPECQGYPVILVYILVDEDEGHRAITKGRPASRVISDDHLVNLTPATWATDVGEKPVMVYEEQRMGLCEVESG